MTTIIQACINIREARVSIIDTRPDEIECGLTRVVGWRAGEIKGPLNRKHDLIEEEFWGWASWRRDYSGPHTASVTL